MSRPNVPRVVDPGLWYRADSKFVNIELHWDRFPDWRFLLDVAVDRAEVIALQIRPRHEEKWASGGLQSSKPPLAGLPLESLLKPARRSIAKRLRSMQPGTYRGFVLSEDGRAIPTTFELDDTETRQAREASASVQRRLGSRRAPSATERLSDAEIATFLRDYLEWVQEGRTVAAFRERYGLSSSDIDNRKTQGENRGLFVRGRQRPRPTGRLTQAGIRALEE